MRFPQSQRELILRLAQCDGNVEEFVKTTDWSFVKPYMIYGAVLGRVPENAATSRVAPSFDPIRAFEDALTSTEFRLGFVKNCLEAFPEKQRLLFVHVPRSGGTNVEKQLACRYGYLTNFVEDPGQASQESFLASLAVFGKAVTQSEKVIVGGHIPLRWFFHHNLYRPCDFAFCIIRNPVDTLISWANYVVTVLRSDLAGRRNDTRVWCNQLAILPSAIEETDPCAMAKRVIFDNHITPPNMLSLYLGDGDFAESISSLTRCSITLIDFHKYRDFLNLKWNLDTKELAMGSDRFLQLQDFSAVERENLCQRAAKDLLIYDILKPYFENEIMIDSQALILPTV